MSEKRKLGNIRKIEDGKYFLRISNGFDAFGKRVVLSRTVYCASKREAEKELAKLYAEKDALTDARRAGKPQTLAALFDTWFEVHVSGLSINTKEFYRNLWKNHVSQFGKCKLCDLSPVICNKIVNESTGRTAQGVYKMLKAMCEKGVSWGYLTTNFFALIDAPKYEKSEKLVFNEQQLHAISFFIAKEDLKYQIIYYFAILCGLRRQEIVALQWGDIDFEKNCFYVRRAAEVRPGEGTTIKETKSAAGNRRLHLPNALRSLLLRYRVKYNAHAVKMGTLWKDTDFIFTQMYGNIMHVHTPSSWWADFIKRHKCLPKVTFHGLRHTAATMMLKNGIPVTVVSGVLGHAQTSTTLNVYAHVIESWDTEAISSMEKLCNGVCNEDTNPTNAQKTKNAVNGVFTTFPAGDPSEIRTPDTLIKSQVLCRLS